MSHYRISCIWLLGALLAGGVGEAQVMCLRECMDYAVAHSTEMRLSAADRSDERAAKQQALLAAFTPSVSAQSYAYNQYGRNLDPETNTYTDFTTFHNGYSLSGGITLFDGFSAINTLRIASIQQQMGLSQEQQSADKVRLATMEAYYQVVYYQQLAEVLRLQAATADSALVRARREEQLGRKGHADVVQMESELAQRQYQLVHAEGQRDQALQTLRETLCWPAGEPLAIAPVGDEEESAVLLAQDTAAFELPAVQIARAALRQSELQVSLARSAWSPSLSLNAGWSTTYYTYPDMAGYQPLSFEEQWKGNGGEYVQLSLNIPLYSKGQRHLSLQKSKNDRARAQARLEQALMERDHTLQRAVDEVANARAAARQSQRLAEVQRQAFALSRRQYELGLIGAIEYQTASQSYLNAEAEQLNAQLQLRLKEHQLHYYLTGKLL